MRAEALNWEITFAAFPLPFPPSACAGGLERRLKV